MKKEMRDSLIAAAALIAGGAFLSAAAFGRLDFDYSRLDTEHYIEKTYAVEKGFDSIYIDGAECGVRLALSADGKCSVVCRETEKAYNTVETEDGRLTVRHVDGRRWYERIGVDFDIMEITVRLPAEDYKSLYIHTQSGDIKVPEGFTFDEAEISSVSGDAEFCADLRGMLALETTSGDLTANGISVKSIRAKSTSGELALSGIKAAGSISLSTVSGDMELTGIRCQEISTESTSGDSRFDDVVAAGHIEAGSVSGGIDFDACDAATLRIETTSGDVGGTLLSAKKFTARTTSGEIRTPASEEGGACEVKTVSGDISFRMAQR